MLSLLRRKEAITVFTSINSRRFIQSRSLSNQLHRKVVLQRKLLVKGHCELTTIVLRTAALGMISLTLIETNLRMRNGVSQEGPATN